MTHATVLERKQEAAAKARRAKRNRKCKRPTQLKPTAAIEPQITYPLEIVPQMFGISRITLRKAQREGLRTHKMGARKYVEGRDLIEHMRRQSETS